MGLALGGIHCFQYKHSLQRKSIICRGLEVCRRSKLSRKWLCMLFVVFADFSKSNTETGIKSPRKKNPREWSQGYIL
jgi:RNA polymerase subunit RPABC4/transcription elongation factor Spt4